MSSPAQSPTRTRHARLANGMPVTLVEDPRSDRAATLLRVAAGSHDEPPAYPGLAHFLEHLAFLGGREYLDGERLMPWLQARGGRVNASTQARHTDYHFEVPGACLGDGLARLFDMLDRPLLDPAAQRSEREVLDAEYHARSTDSTTLIDAALATAVASYHPIRRFVAGRRSSLPVEEAAFQQALWQFHKRYYQPANLTLWLQGPQDLDELQALAEAHFGGWPQRPPSMQELPPSLLPLTGENLSLRLPGAPRLVLGLVVDALNPAAEQTLDVLGDLLADESPGGLMADLGERGLCDCATLRVVFHGATDALLAVTFELAEEGCEAAVEAAFNDWLAALQARPEPVLAARLPLVGLDRLEPMDQLRERVRGLPAPLSSPLLPAMLVAPRIRLLVSADAEGVSTQASGFALVIGRLPVVEPPPVDGAWRFVMPEPASEQANGRLHMRWRFAERPCRSHFLVRRRALRALAGLSRLQGVNLRIDEEGCDWTLTVAGPGDRLPGILEQALPILRQPGAAFANQGLRLLARERSASDLPIRRLLGALPSILAGPGKVEPDWAAARWDALALGTELPASAASLGEPATCPLLPPPLDAGRHWHRGAGEGEAALLLFCPLPDRSVTCEAAWRLLARALETDFYRRLRSELNLGYALFCGFRQVAGWRGILFAVQSPHCAPDELLGHLEAFLQGAAKTLHELADSTLQVLAEALASSLAPSGPNWADQLAGVDDGHAQALSEVAGRLSRADLLAAHAELLSEQGGWCLLASDA